MTTQQRRRAPAMSLDERREAIVRAALPLLLEHGANLSTRQIANAAGIAEGTVFRVFTDKDELLRTCLSEAFRTNELRDRIRAISHEHELSKRLVDAGLLVLEHVEQLGQLMQSLAASGYNIHQYHQQETSTDPQQGAGQERGAGRQATDQKPGTDRDKPAQFMNELSETCMSLLASDEHRVRVPGEQLIRMFLGQLSTARLDPTFRHDRRTALAQRVDVLLNGALVTETPAEKTPHEEAPVTGGLDA